MPISAKTDEEAAAAALRKAKALPAASWKGKFDADRYTTTSRGFFHLSTASQLGELEEDGLEGFYNWIEEEVEKTKRSRPANVIHFMPHYMRRLQQNKRDK